MSTHGSIEDEFAAWAEESQQIAEETWEASGESWPEWRRSEAEWLAEIHAVWMDKGIPEAVAVLQVAAADLAGVA